MSTEVDDNYDFWQFIADLSTPVIHSISTGFSQSLNSVYETMETLASKNYLPNKTLRILITEMAMKNKLSYSEITKIYFLASYIEQRPNLTDSNDTKIFEFELSKVLKHLNCIEDFKRVCSLMKYLMEAIEAAEKALEITPRSIQILAVILMINKHENTGGNGINGNMYEIATGEGKSLIVAILAGYLVKVKHGKVDILTSSWELAEREAKRMSHFFKILDISCCAVPEVDVPGKYEADICFGPPSSFIFDLLRDEHRPDGVKLRNGRPFAYLIMDEADKLVIDDFGYSYCISQNLTGNHHLELLYTMIWSQVSRFTWLKNIGKDYVSSNRGSIWNVLIQVLGLDGLESYDVLIDLAINNGIIEVSDDERNLLTQKVSEASVDNSSANLAALSEFDNQIQSQMTQEKVIQYLYIILTSGMFDHNPFELFVMSEDGEISQEDIQIDGKVKVDNPIVLFIDYLGTVSHLIEMNEFKSMVTNMLNDQITFKGNFTETEQFCFPMAMKNIIESKLEVFVHSAVRATLLEEKVDYVIKSGQIRIINRSTGEFASENCHWSDGLHEMIQLKHGLAITDSTVYDTWMKIFKYVLNYHGNVFGLSGTLAIQSDGSILTEVFKMNLWAIPTFRPIIRKELRPIILPNDLKDLQWLEAISKDTCEMVAQNRSVLVIADSIKDCEMIENKLKVHLIGNSAVIKSYYLSDDDSHKKTVNVKIDSGSVIVASNLGGRGTDFQLNQDVIESGGLHIIMTYFAQNDRIERQAFGRAGRKGEPGSARLIINKNRSSVWPADVKGFDTESVIKIMRETRAHNIQHQLRSYKHSVEGDMKWRDLLDFWHFSLSSYSPKFKNLMNEQFAIWHQGDKEFGNLTLEEMKFKTTNFLKQMIRAIEYGDISNGVSPYFLLNFKKDMHITSLDRRSLINLAIEADPDWAVIPYYLLAGIEAEKGNSSAAKQALEKANSCLERHQTEFIHLFSMGQCMQDCKNLSKGKLQHDKLNGRQGVLSALHENIKNNLKELESAIESKEKVKVKFDDLEELIESKTRTENETSEIQRMKSCGLEKVLTITKRKPFSWSAFWVTALGVAQIIGGFAAIVLSGGALTSLGTCLIIEGISDAIEGIKGMITGSFSLAQWAIGKAISLAVSLVCFGFSKVMKYGKSCFSAMKSSFSKGLTILKGMTSTAKSVSCSTIAKTAGKVIVKESVKYAVNEAASIAIDQVYDAIIKEIFDEFKPVARRKFYRSLHSGNLNAFAKNSVKYAGVVLQSPSEPQMKRFLKDFAEQSASRAFIEVETSTELMTVLEHIQSVSTQVRGKVKANHKTVANVMKLADVSAKIASISKALEQSFALFDDLVNEMNDASKKTLKEINQELPALESEDVNPYVGSMADGCSDAFINHLRDLISRGITQHLKTKLKTVASEPINKYMDNQLKISKNINSLKAHGKRQTLNTASSKKILDPEKIPTLKKATDKWTSQIKDPNYPGDISDARVYADRTKKRINIYKVDKDGKPKFDQSVGGSRSQEEINLAYYPSTTTDGLGHYAPMTNDKQILHVDSSSGNSCLYDSLAHTERMTSSKNIGNLASHSKSIRELNHQHVISNPDQSMAIMDRKLSSQSYLQNSNYKGQNFFYDGGKVDPKSLKNQFDDFNEKFKSLSPEKQKELIGIMSTCKSYEEQLQLKKELKNDPAFQTPAGKKILNNIQMDHIIPQETIKIVEQFYNDHPDNPKGELYKYLLDNYGSGEGHARRIDPNKLPAVPVRAPAHRNQMTSGFAGGPNGPILPGGSEQGFRQTMADKIIFDDFRGFSRTVLQGVDPCTKFIHDGSQGIGNIGLNDEFRYVNLATTGNWLSNEFGKQMNSRQQKEINAGKLEADLGNTYGLFQDMKK